MPWRARTDVGLSCVALALVASVVVSCVSVTTQAVAPETQEAVGEVSTAASTRETPPLADARVPLSSLIPKARSSLAADSTRRATPTPSSAPEPAPVGSRAPSLPPIRLGAAMSSVAPTPLPSLSTMDQAPATDPVAQGDSPRPSMTSALDQPPASLASAATAALAPAASPAPAATPAPTDPSAVPSDAPPPVALVVPADPPPSGTAASPEHQAPVLDRATLRKIERVLARTTGKKRVAGIQVAVRLANGDTWLGDSGSAAFAPRRAIEDDTVFAIASVSKTFIAALILQLAEEGKLDLDAPYGRYVGEGPQRKHVSVRQLLSHTSGIYDYFANPRYVRTSTAWLRTRPQRGLMAREHAWTFEEIMDLVRPARYCKPGACYHYSNTNYVLLGRVAEAVGGAPLDRLLRRRFFRPLGLADTYYQPAERPPADAAHGHWPSGSGYTDHTRDDQLRPFTAAVTAAGAAGAIASTARDLTVWADALYGGKVLSRASLLQLTAIQPEGSYGLGTDYAVFAGHPALGHRGGLRGFEASMWYFPEARVSIAIVSNQGNWFTSPARSIDVPMQGIVRAVLGRRRH